MERFKGITLSRKTRVRFPDAAMFGTFLPLSRLHFLLQQTIILRERRRVFEEEDTWPKFTPKNQKNGSLAT